MVISTIAVCWASGIAGSNGVLSTFSPLVAGGTREIQFRRRYSGKSQADLSLMPVLSKHAKANSCF